MTSKKVAPEQGAGGGGAGEAVQAEQAFARYLPEAKALAAHEIVPFRADAQLALTNVQQGVKNVLAKKAKLAGKVDADELARIAELPQLALAASFAASRVNLLLERSDGSIADKLSRARKVRRVLLKSADACAEAGVIPAEPVAAIVQGRGQIDTAKDCVDLAALFRAHAKQLEGKTPATPALVEEASVLGTELLTLLRQAHAPADSTPSAKLVEASDARDRLWTLLTSGHETLWKAGAIAFGKAVDEHVPPLQSRVLPPKQKPEPKAPPPPK